MTWYTEKWGEFQFRAPCYLDGHSNPYQFDLVKWVSVETPMKTRDGITGQKKTIDSYCIVIATVTWDVKEQCFGFQSIGLRYLLHRIDGLEEWIMKFCQEMEKNIGGR